MSISSHPTRNTLSLLLLASTLLPLAKADTCYTWYNRAYECNRSGLSTGARIGIGLGIAVLIIAIAMAFSYYRRKRIMEAWKNHVQHNPPLPYHNGQTGDQYQPPNQPYPGAQSYNSGTYNYNQNGINKPAQTYQPSMAGAYGTNGSYNYGQYNNNNNGNANGNGDLGEHSYEYQQAEEDRRQEEEEARRAAGGAGGQPEAPPPGYDVTTQHTGTTAASPTTYAPPPGPPPTHKRQQSGGVV